MNNKIGSRKLWVWIIWTIFALVSVIVTKSLPPDLISWFGVISLAYLGTNTLTKYFTGGKDVKQDSANN